MAIMIESNLTLNFYKTPINLLRLTLIGIRDDNIKDPVVYNIGINNTLFLIHQFIN